jgi:hypothetical protein
MPKVTTGTSADGQTDYSQKLFPYFCWNNYSSKKSQRASSERGAHGPAVLNDSQQFPQVKHI